MVSSAREAWVWESWSHQCSCNLLPAPRVLPYVLLFLLFGIAFAGAVWMPEPVARHSRPRLAPQHPGVPPSARRAFRLASLGVISSWSLAGLFLSLGPELAGSLFHTADHLATGLSVLALCGPSAAAQVVFRRTSPLAGAAFGSVILAAGTVVIVTAVASHSSALFLVGVVVAGSGFGVAFLGALRALSEAIPPGRGASVTSAFYVVAYSALSLPAILAGVLVTPLGLDTTVEIFGGVIALLALVVATEARHMRSPGRTTASGTRSVPDAA